jgi:hypothetical protein
VPQRCHPDVMTRDANIGDPEGHAEHESQVGEVGVVRRLLLVEVDESTGSGAVVGASLAKGVERMQQQSGERDADERQQHEHEGDREYGPDAENQYEQLSHSSLRFLGGGVGLRLLGILSTDVDPDPTRLQRGGETPADGRRVRPLPE